MEIIRVLSSQDLEIETLLRESAQEGFAMLESLLDAYQSGLETYRESNELLIIANDEYGNHLGIGSLSKHPSKPDCGVINHHYVLPHYRNMGIGYEIYDWLMRHAQDHYKILEINQTMGDKSREFYLRRGFEVAENQCLRLILESK